MTAEERNRDNYKGKRTNCGSDIAINILAQVV